MTTTHTHFTLLVKEILDYQTNKIGELHYYIPFIRTEREVYRHDSGGKPVLRKRILTFTGTVIPASPNGIRQTLATIKFNAYMLPRANEVSLTGGDVHLGHPSLHGYRIGSYLMSQIVLWAKQWPEANVRKIGVYRVDADTDETRTRRNRFYEQCNIKFQYVNSENRSGHSLPTKCSELNVTESWRQNIEVLPEYSVVERMIRELSEVKLQLRSTQRSTDSLKQHLDNIYASPFSFATNLWKQRYLTSAIFSSIFIVTIAIFAIRLTLS